MLDESPIMTAGDMMDEDPTTSLPTKSTADHALALVRGAISAVPVVGGVGAELFAMIVRAPYDRRAKEWMRHVGDRLRLLSERDEHRFRALFEDEEFASVLIAATQAATRSHRREKTKLLANGVEQSARKIDVSTDLQLLFVRFVDEMTLTHVALLRMLETRGIDVASVKSYLALYDMFTADTRATCTTEEFQLFCNDLGARVLARFSASLDEFPGVAESDAIVTEDSGRGTMVLVSDLGRSFLKFVGLDTRANIV